MDAWMNWSRFEFYLLIYEFDIMHSHSFYPNYKYHIPDWPTDEKSSSSRYSADGVLLEKNPQEAQDGLVWRIS